MALGVATSNVLTLADLARFAKDPKARSIIEILSLTNEILDDAPASPCNNKTVHKTTLRDDIPLPAFRMMNEGAPTVKSATRQRMEHTGLLENWLEADDQVLRLTMDKSGALLEQSKGILEGISQAGVEALFYGDMEINPASFTGFTPRYNTLDSAIPQARNVVDAGGVGIPDPLNPGYTTNLTSIWLIQWDAAACHLIYPEGTVSGVEQQIYNDQVILDSNGDKFSGTRVKYSWYLGLAVNDWRRAVRICNVDSNSLYTLISGGAPTSSDLALLRQLQYAITLLPYKSSMRTAFYMNRIPHTMIDMLSSEKPNVQLTFSDPQGTPPQKMFQGIPLRRCDSLITGEPQVTA